MPNNKMTVLFGRRECDSVEVDREIFEVVQLMCEDGTNFYDVTSQLENHGFDAVEARAIALLAKSSK